MATITSKFKAKLEKDPQNVKTWLDYIGWLIAQGSSPHLSETLLDALSTLEKSFILPERFYHPVIKALAGQGLWKEIEILTSDLERSYAKDIPEDEALRRILRKGRKYIEMGCPVEHLFPPHIKGEDWWKGPHLVEDTEDLEAWFPAHVTHWDEEEVALVFFGKNEYGALDKAAMVIPRDLIQGYLKEDSILEVGVYANGDIQVLIHESKK